jgi:hypothetical protein
VFTASFVVGFIAIAGLCGKPYRLMLATTLDIAIAGLCRGGEPNMLALRESLLYLSNHLSLPASILIMLSLCLVVCPSTSSF